MKRMTAIAQRSGRNNGSTLLSDFNIIYETL